MHSRTIARCSDRIGERRTPIRCWRLLVILLVIVLLGGCGRDSATCVGRTWDLRTPPSRADVDMPPGRKWVSWQCDDPQEMTFQLPADTVLSIPSTGVTFDSYGAPHPETGDPTTADVHTGPIGLDAAEETASEILTTLGANTGEIAEWRRQAAAAAGTDTVRSPFIRSRVGYLGVEMRTTYNPLSDSAHVHVIFLMGDQIGSRLWRGSRTGG